VTIAVQWLLHRQRHLHARPPRRRRGSGPPWLGAAVV